MSDCAVVKVGCDVACNDVVFTSACWVSAACNLVPPRDGPGDHILSGQCACEFIAMFPCCRTPDKLLAAIDLIVDTYERSAGSAGMLGQAGALMNPEVIVRMKDIQAAIRKDFT